MKGEKRKKKIGQTYRAQKIGIKYRPSAALISKYWHRPEKNPYRSTSILIDNEIACGLFSLSIVSFIMRHECSHRTNIDKRIIRDYCTNFFSPKFTVLVIDENGEESEEPPVPVVKEIKEKDAFYSKKYTQHPSLTL